jgi:ribosomal protein L34E
MSDKVAGHDGSALSEGLGVHALPVDYSALTQPERRAVREEYVRRQRGKCSHCGSELSGAARGDVRAKRVNARLFPPNFFKWPVHLHHCHKTGMTIGAVHNYCNAVLWQYHGE